MDDIEAEARRLKKSGLKFTMDPKQRGPVKLAIFSDTCGNLIDVPAASEPGMISVSAVFVGYCFLENLLDERIARHVSRVDGYNLSSITSLNGHPSFVQIAGTIHCPGLTNCLVSASSRYRWGSDLWQREMRSSVPER